MIIKKISFLLILLSLAACETTPYYGNVPGGSKQVSTISGDLNSADLAKLTEETLAELFENNPRLNDWRSRKPLVKVPNIENLTAQLDSNGNRTNRSETSSLNFDLPRQIIKEQLHIKGLAVIANDKATNFDYYLKSYISEDSRQYDLRSGLPTSIWSMKISVVKNSRRNQNVIATAVKRYP